MLSNEKRGCVFYFFLADGDKEFVVGSRQGVGRERESRLEEAPAYPTSFSDNRQENRENLRRATAQQFMGCGVKHTQTH